jgi:hypothetical protein
MVYLYDACDQISTVTEKNILDGRTEVKQYTPSAFGERGYNKTLLLIKQQKWLYEFGVKIDRVASKN